MMTAKEIFSVLFVVAVSSATPTTPADVGSISSAYSTSTTEAPHEQQLQKMDYVLSEPYPTQSTPRKVDEGDGWLSSWRVAGRLLLDCSKSGDLVGCLKLKAVTSLGRALTSVEPVPLPLPFIDGVSLARDPQAQVPLPTEALDQSDAEVEASLPRGLDERGARLDRLLIDRLEAFLKTRTLQVSVPLSTGLAAEGRGKGGLGGKKGHGYLILMIAGLKAMMMQSAMGGIAMLSGKALLVAKIALLLALLCCLKKGGGEESKSHQIVYAAPAPEHSSGGSGGWQSSGSGGDWSKRSVTADPYSAYNPQSTRY